MSNIPELPIGYIHQRQDVGYVIKTDHGWELADGSLHPKEDYPSLYSILLFHPSRSRWQKIKDWFAKREPPAPYCAYGETEDEFRIPDLRGSIHQIFYG